MSISSFLLSSCIGSVSNNIDSKVEAKVDSQITANANIQANANANLNTNVKTGEIKTNLQDKKLKKSISISVLPSNFTINVGDEIKLVGTVKYNDDSIDNNILWFSSNSSIIKINQESGVLNAISEGKIQITATSKLDTSINTVINITINSKNSVRETSIPTKPVLIESPTSSNPTTPPSPIQTTSPILQNDPEIIMIKINDKIVTDSDSSSTLNPSPRKPDILIPNVTGVSSDLLNINITFIKPVIKDDVENYFRITSQSNFDNRISSFVIDKTSSYLSFIWSADEASVTVKTIKGVLSNKAGNEAKYMIDFKQVFRDKNGNTSKINKYFNFGSNKKNDFTIFSVKNKDLDPFITSCQAIDGGSANDTLKITFNESMDVINQTVPQALLSDPTDFTTSNDSTLQLFAYNTNNINSNNVTILGFKEKSTGLFKSVYSIARITSSDLQNAVNKSSSNLCTKALDGGFINTFTQYGGIEKPLKSVKVNGNNIIIELNPRAFDKDDRVIIAVGQTIDGKYDDKINSIFVPSLKSILANNSINFIQITNPSGRIIDKGNSSTFANIDINNSQKVSITQ